jgi:hypothetical protein
MAVTVSLMANLVRAHFTEHALRWGLNPQSLQVDCVPSPGGFGPMNFTVGDGTSLYHVKLGESPTKLSAWVRAASHLTERYRAPRLFNQIELGGRYGAVFERLTGETPAQSVPSRTLDEIVLMLSGLHQDRELAELLGGGSVLARDTFLGYHIAMCEDDLDEVEDHLPLPCVDKTTAQWMRAETQALREAALHSAAFNEQVSSPIHGDLWFGNVLLGGNSWWIIDWDDLKIGDPAHDLSLILFTALDDIAAFRWLEGRDAAFIERFRIYARAALLTFVVDPLADWVAAESYPEVRDDARPHRESLHRY